MSELIQRRFPGAEIAPLDAWRLVGQAPASASKEFDLIHANGDLDLLPLLRRLLPKLAKRLRVGGRLGVHFPNNLYEPNRELARMVAADGPWSKRLLPVAKTRPFNETMEALYELLNPVYASVDIWESTYLCPLSTVSEIVDFMKPASLAPFLRPLDEGLRRAFLDRYLIELAEAYPARRDGSVLFRFPRIFVLAKR
jgi:trans-aconitate 2-methyltransferase